MAGYFVANYTITNQAGYQEYLAAVGPILAAHGAENIVIDRDPALQPDGTPRADDPFADPRFAGAEILVTGANFGCGSSRETAVWAVKGMG